MPSISVVARDVRACAKWRLSYVKTLSTNTSSYPMTFSLLPRRINSAWSTSVQSWYAVKSRFAWLFVTWTINTSLMQSTTFTIKRWLIHWLFATCCILALSHEDIVLALDLLYSTSYRRVLSGHAIVVANGAMSYDYISFPNDGWNVIFISLVAEELIWFSPYRALFCMPWTKALLLPLLWWCIGPKFRGGIVKIYPWLFWIANTLSARVAGVSLGEPTLRSISISLSRFLVISSVVISYIFDSLSQLDVSFILAREFSVRHQSSWQVIGKGVQLEKD